MQSKLVENWLISAKEISFTAPFVQLLLTEGYTVIQAKGGVLEQGKDIIAKDSDGNIHCYQLKCSNIGSSEWQSINGQLNDLTQIPPIHPTITKTPTSWNCYLVTNGDITGPVSRTIADYSNTQQSQGKMPLQTISREQLLRRFTDAFGQFFPAEPNDIRIFFELYCEDGDNVLKREEFKRYFERFLQGFDTKSKQKKLEALQAAPILASYLLTNKYTQENHIAIIDAWVLTLMTILYYANKWSLAEKRYLATENLILEELDRQIVELIDDVAENDSSLIDTTYGVFSEPVITFRLRCAELLGYISAAINYSVLSGRELPSVPSGLAEKAALLAQKKMVISESGIPGQFNVLLASAISNKQSAAVTELKTLVEGIIASHVDDGSGLLSPYYSTEQAVANLFGVGDPIEESFHNRSYMLWTAILLLVKYDEREFLNERWAIISEICMEEVVAHDQNDLLLWKADKADMLDTFPDATQSWSKLRISATKSYDNEIPSILLNKKYLIPFMVMAMPHRLTPKLILCLLNK